MYCKQVWPTSAFTVIKQNVHLSSLIVKRPDTNKVGWFFCLSCIIIMSDISDPTSIRRVYLYTYGWVKTLILLLKILFKQPGINNFVSLTLEHMLRTRYDSSVQFSAQLCPSLCNPMGCSTPGFPVHHHLPELTQTHVRRVGDAFQPSHPLLSPFLPALNLSQQQGLF